MTHKGWYVIKPQHYQKQLWYLVEIGQAVLEKKNFKNYEILYMYIAQGQGQKTLGDKILIVQGFATLIIYCKFQPLFFNTFWETKFSIFPHTKA